MVAETPSAQTVSRLSSDRLKKLTINFLLKYGMLVAIVLLIAFFATQSEYFFTASNFLNIARAVSILTIVAIGVTMSVVVDGFDVSVGSVTGLAVILAPALMVIWEVPWQWAMLITMAVGVVVGLFNAFLIVKLRIPDLLATLGVLYLIQGAQMSITKGDAVYRGMVNPWNSNRAIAPGEIPQTFKNLGQGYVLKNLSSGDFHGIPIPVMIMILVALAFHLLLQYTRFGRMFYATGGNREAARLSGIPVNQYRTLAYILSAGLATFGGLILAARIGSGAVKAGEPYLLDGVAATYFGFAVLGARRPNVFGTVLGALFVGIMLNGLTMMNVSWFYQDVIKGSVLIISLGMSFYLVKRE